MKKPVIFAHRGASAYAPENTGAAFKKAIAMKADGIELDVHLTQDGHIVVIHDERVDRTSNGTGWVKDMKLSELKGLDFGSWFGSDFKGETILTLEEVLDLLKGWDGILNVELKSGPIFYEGLEQKTLDVLKAFRMTGRTIISSFNHYSLLTVKRIEPGIKTGILYMAGLVEPWDYAKKVGADAIHPYFVNIQPPIVQGCKAHGILMNPFTVDKPEHIRALALADVDGIITNVPDTAIAVVSSLMDQ